MGDPDPRCADIADSGTGTSLAFYQVARTKNLAAVWVFFFPRPKGPAYKPGSETSSSQALESIPVEMGKGPTDRAVESRPRNRLVGCLGMRSKRSDASSDVPAVRLGTLSQTGPRN